MKLEMRAHGIELTGQLRTHIENRLRFALSRFEGRLRRVHVLLEDVNGPKGGNDIHCKARADLSPRGELLIRGVHNDPFAAVVQTTERLSHAVARHIERSNARRRGRAGRLVADRRPARLPIEQRHKQVRSSDAH